ncbi:YqzH family protein [Anoxybacillus sp. PDR2]|jgi:YqzH-like protein|nr:YqzH family protein [Anoxybacillus sp. PDR2]
MMNEQWLRKLIRNVLHQYGYHPETWNLDEDEWHRLCAYVTAEKEKNRNADIYELVHDAVYEFITNM